MVLQRRRLVLPAMFALAALAPWEAASAQQRISLDPGSSGVIYPADLPSGQTAEFLLTLRAGQGVLVEAAPIVSWEPSELANPVIEVFDPASAEPQQPIVQNDNGRPSSDSAVVRLYFPQEKTVRIAVSNSGGAGSRFELILRRSDYRPAPRSVVMGDDSFGQLFPGEEQIFRFDGKEGETWELSLEATGASGLDPMLEVIAGDDPGGTVVASDDDGGGGLNARVLVPIRTPGPYTVRARSIVPAGGSYRFRAADGKRPENNFELGVGSSIEETLAADSPEHVYRLSQAAKDWLAGNSGFLTIRMEAVAGDVDPLLELGFETPLGFSSVRRDDDGAGGKNAELVIGTFEAGDLASDPSLLDRLRIKASSFFGEGGKYRIALAWAPSQDEYVELEDEPTPDFSEQ